MKGRNSVLLQLSKITILVAVVTVLLSVVSSCVPQESEKPAEKKGSLLDTEKPGVTLPEFSVLDEDIYDAPIKTQVKLELLVSGEITETGLKALLNKLYQETRQREGFEYHDSPTHIAIYAYADRERAESGMGQWIAMLIRMGEDDEPAITVNERQLSELAAKPKERFGLSENSRKEIFKELVLVEDRAQAEAEKQHPLEPTKSLQIGSSLTLTKETPLMPELEPEDPLAALQQMRRLPADCSIKVLQVSEKDGTPWYYVEAKSPSHSIVGSGWINSIALMGQSKIDFQEQIRRQGDVGRSLEEKYKGEIADRYGLSLGQLREISKEGLEKDWPLPE